MNEIDHEFIDFIVSKSDSEVVKKKFEKEWVKHTTENNVKIDVVWQEKLKERKKHSKVIKLKNIVILIAITLIIV